MENNANSSNLNKIKKRYLMLSPTVKAGLEKECVKSDFFREGDKAVGVGGFGEVWKVIHKATNKLYVIKVIDKKNIIKQKMVDQMNREIEIMYKVHHPHVVKLINHFEDDDKFYLVMLFASRGQLYSLLKKSARFDQRTAAQYMREVLSAVKYLHSFDPPIIHRDIKPENLLLDENGRIKLADFGWSNFKSDDVSRVTYCGTPEYLSPEMVKKSGHDTSVDIWALGVLLFELLAGHAPFSGSSQEELFQNIRKLKINWPADFPPLAKNLVSKILKLNPNDRVTVDEILSHAWFEKNPPIKPVLNQMPNDPKSILESQLISGNSDKLGDQINKVLKEEDKLKNKISITRLTRNKDNNENSNSNGGSSNNLIQGKNISQSQIDPIAYNTLVSDNEKLIKENSDVKIKFERLENEMKQLKIEYSKMKEVTSTHNTLQEELFKLNEEVEKYKIMNRDRLDMLTEIEEKNNQIFDLGNKLRQSENESATLLKTNNTLNEKLSDAIKLNETNEIKLNELRAKLNELMKEKEVANMDYQKKLEILQNKILDEDAQLDAPKVMVMLMDSVEDMKSLFKSKIASMSEFLKEKKEEINRSESLIASLTREKVESVFDLLNKLKNGLEDDITKAKIKIQKELPSKNSEMIEWLKRQINELQPFKNKYTFLDNKTTQFESTIKLLQAKLTNSEDKVTSLEKMQMLQENKFKESKFYCENLEAKLSDVKDFVFKNCPDQLDSFNSSFKNY